METEVVIGLGRDPIGLMPSAQKELSSGNGNLERLSNRLIKAALGDPLEFTDLMLSKSAETQQLIVDTEFTSMDRRDKPGIIKRYHTLVDSGFIIGLRSSLALFLTLKQAQDLPIHKGYDAVRDPNRILDEPRELTSENPTYKAILQALKQNASITSNNSTPFGDLDELKFFPLAFDCGVQFSLECLAARHRYLTDRLGPYTITDEDIRTGIPELTV